MINEPHAQQASGLNDALVDIMLVLMFTLLMQHKVKTYWYKQSRMLRRCI